MEGTARRAAPPATGSSGVLTASKKVDVSAPIRRRARRALPEYTGLQAAQGDADPSFSDFLPDAFRIVRTPVSRGRRLLAYALCAAIIGAIVWACLGHLPLFAIAPGEFQIRGGTQVIESVEAGHVSTLPVANGSHIDKGAVVLKLDSTLALATKSIVEAKLANARAEGLRRRAAASAAQNPAIDQKARIVWPETIPADVRRREEAVLSADIARLAATIAALQSKLNTEQAKQGKYIANVKAQETQIESRAKRTAMHEKLASQGWDSRATVLRSLEPLRQDQVTLANYQGLLGEVEAAIAVVKNEIAEARATFIADNTDAAANAEREAVSLAEQLKKADLALANLTLRAPVSGIVQSLSVINIGQAVKIGEKLMQIVPDKAPLELQAYVLNTDIGFVKVGQPVTIKIDTFPFTRYGTIPGRVMQVGADAVTGDYALLQQKDDTATLVRGPLSATNPAQQVTDLVFPVTIVPDRFTINVGGRDVPLTSGMSAVAEIETDRQRAIAYVLYPLTRVIHGSQPQKAVGAR